MHEMEPEILESEIRSAIAQLLNRKSPGIDGIPIELVKALGDRGTRMMHEMCNEIWRTREWPQQWKQSVYIPIPKKGDPRECGNNRTIALITHASKVLLKVLQRRIEPYMQRTWKKKNLEALGRTWLQNKQVLERGGGREIRLQI